MQLAHVAGWGIREAVRGPTHWALALAALSIGPICLVVAPVGIVADAGPSGSYLPSIWYLSCYLGALSGLVLLGRAEDLWQELERGRQVLVAAAALLAVAAFHGLLALASAAPFVAPTGLPWAGAVLCAAHWSVIGAFVQRLPLQIAGKCFALSALGWWIPALLAGASGWERVRWLLGPGRHLEAAGVTAETSLAVLSDTMPLVAWWVAAALLPTRSALRR